MKEINIDGHKLMYHPERVAEWIREGDCFPIYVEIGPTNKCNHRCIYCALDWLKHGSIDIKKDVLGRNLENMALTGVKSVMFAGEGEPLLHKDIGYFVEIAKTSGMDVSMTTNGVLFSSEKANEILKNLSWIRFSVDTSNPKTYSEIHRTRENDLDKLMENIRYSCELNSRKNYGTTIGVQALLMKDNLREIVQLAKDVKELGANNLQIKPYSHHPSSNNNLAVDYNEAEKIHSELESLGNDKFQVIYRTATIKRVCEGRNYGECFGLPFFALIDSGGNVIPCNLFYNNPKFTYGNVNENIFSDIWNSGRRKQVIECIKNKGINDCRIGCRLDVINMYLDRLKNPQAHDNFI